MAHHYIPYSSIKTGDILLFSSWTLQSLVLRLGTGSEWTHAGIAVWLNTGDYRQLHVFEMSVINDSYCALAKGYSSGCRLVDICQVVGNYAKICSRRLNINRDKAFYEKLECLMNEYKGRQFQNNYIKLAMYNSGFFRRPATDTDNSIICSQLCAIWLDRLGLIPPSIVADYPHYRATPSNFFDCVIYPRTMFDGEPLIVHDNGMDNPINTTFFVIEMCSLFLYILLTVDDERSYRQGYRRRPEMKKKINKVLAKLKMKKRLK
jgi:hypothetical protein